ncbi:hypothetical protein AVKW3434_02665 [Acidovorax sp. SUPP3434]|uniref:hypothetical protein n=1 Tax=Acidovorax sp. SUPP3434 TaxID=2920880 RepID=UPI0023DE5D3F|nr:hypothetical protein [Acidovorax sp. SUPP3434]GKS98243.1 hypothetical protein AVKW3434_02665 [Acidovorax sp. SUPP3434]
MERAKNGRRVAISLVCWLFSSVGVLMSLTMIVSSSMVAVIADPASAVRGTGFYLGIAAAFAWLALIVMNLAWLREERTSLLWPMGGGLAGMVCTAAFLPFIFLFLPCLLLGLYLCNVHLSGSASDETSAN